MMNSYHSKTSEMPTFHMNGPLALYIMLRKTRKLKYYSSTLS